MCPAEENASCGKLRLINAKRSSEKIDTRTNSFQAAGLTFCGRKLFFVGNASADIVSIGIILILNIQS